MEERKFYKSLYKDYSLQCYLQKHCLRLQVSCSTLDDKMYFVQYSQDSFPENLSQIFKSYDEFYQFLSEQTPQTAKFKIQKPSEIIFLVEIWKRVKEYPVYLTEKEVSKQKKLENKIQQLKREVKRLKDIEVKYQQMVKGKEEDKVKEEEQRGKEKKIALLEEQNQKMRKKLVKLQMDLSKKQNQTVIHKEQKQKKEFNQLQINSLKKEIINLESQNLNLKQKMRESEEQKKSFDMIIKDLNEEVASSRNLLQNITKQLKIQDEKKEKKMEQNVALIDPEGFSVSFHPKLDCANILHYNVNSNTVRKNDIELNHKKGRFLPTANPLPSAGRYFYKLKLVSFSAPLSLRFGFISKLLPESEAYIAAGQPNSIMYSTSEGDSMIFEGNTLMEAFLLKKDEVICMLVDQDKKEVEWHLNGSHLFTSSFTDKMKEDNVIYFFVQLYNNGDTVEFLSS